MPFMLWIMMSLGVGHPAMYLEMVPTGEMIGKVVDVERVTDGVGSPGTVYTLVAFWDSSYVGASRRRGDSMRLYTPGGLGVMWEDRFSGSLSTASLVVGEKCWIVYREMEGHLSILDKWTVWRRGVGRAMGTPDERDGVVVADVRLEELLAGGR